jgi:MSHA biogenesis protein MshO
MRQIHLESRRRAASGVTLIELVVALVLVAVILGLTVYLLSPVRQAIDITTRAELTDIADNALQRIGREVRMALPNSVRQTTSGGSDFLEFLPIRTAGRYRAESSAAACAAGTDELAFDSVDTCFKSLGQLIILDPVTTDDFLVLSNYGVGFANQNAYELASPTTTNPRNRRKITAFVNEGSRWRVEFNSAVALSRVLHESPGKRFYVVKGDAGTALPQAVTFECNPASGAGTLFRRWGYPMKESPQPTLAADFSTGTAALLASNVSACSFDYQANVAAQMGLLTVRLTLSKTRSDGGIETVSLYHAIHVSNVP